MKDLLVFFLSMVPVTELQGGIAYGLTILDLPPWRACLAGVLGSTTVAFMLILGLDPVTRFARKHIAWIDRFCHWLFERTRAKYSPSMSELGHLALFTYVAIPTPGSGAWTGALIAYLFAVPLKKAVPILGFGLVVTGLIVTFGVEGLLLLFRPTVEEAPTPEPQVFIMTEEDLESRKDQKEHLLKEGVVLTLDGEDWNIPAQEKDLIFSKTEAGVHLQLDEPFMKYVLQTAQTEINRKAGNLTLLQISEGQVQSENKPYKVDIEGQVLEGRKVHPILLRVALMKMLQEGQTAQEVPVTRTAGKILNQTSLDLGPLEEIGVGKSSYWGSSPEREFNIEKALTERFNGIVIPPGAEFSYVEFLGPIEGSGWKQAYTIFQGTKLEKAPAGGVCQVSTTVYRAALDAGLEITEHRNHSLYVIYYQHFGDGLDATVFPGEQDFKFVNNTSNHMLMVAQEEGYKEAVLRFYGENDGRSTELYGPYTASTQTEEVITGVGASLGIGQIAWKYILTHPDGTIENQWLLSDYMSPAQQHRGETPGLLDY
ncbi:VanW family protein [Candidatus Peregrinibacteria bacterium]|nr:MAG: VanW family protein [Candidatus Peregrinibacteria bacterium]